MRGKCYTECMIVKEETFNVKFKQTGDVYIYVMDETIMIIKFTLTNTLFHTSE